jgi:hypothetical protein
MMKILGLALALGMGAGSWAHAPLANNLLTVNALSGLEVGQKAPLLDREMPGVDGLNHTLNSTMGPNGTVVVFSCNTCPFVVGNGEKSEGWEGRYNELAARLESLGFGMILVNSNEAKREGVDSMSAMVEHAKEAEYTAPYVVDANHELADAFGAMKTPHVFMLDASGILIYTGAIDDNVNRAGEVSERYVLEAAKSASRGESISISSTPAVGCSIKRVGA